MIVDNSSTYYAGVVATPQWLTPAEEETWRALQFMQMHVEAEMERDLSAMFDLSYQDYLVLVSLTDVPDGRLRLFQLSDVLGREKSRLSHHIRRMEERGLVERQQCDSDRRGCFIAVTEDGRARLREAAPTHLASVRRLFFDHLTSEQVRVVGASAQRVLAALEATSSE